MGRDEAAPRQYFTQEARDAALARRRELAALPKAPTGSPRLFVTRGASAENDFGWEIRRFGGLVVARSDTGYPTEAEARRAGERAADDIPGASGRQSVATLAKSAMPTAIQTT